MRAPTTVHLIQINAPSTFFANDIFTMTKLRHRHSLRLAGMTFRAFVCALSFVVFATGLQPAPATELSASGEVHASDAADTWHSVCADVADQDHGVCCIGVMHCGLGVLPVSDATSVHTITVRYRPRSPVMHHGLANPPASQPPRLSL